MGGQDLESIVWLRVPMCNHRRQHAPAISIYAVVFSKRFEKGREQRHKTKSMKILAEEQSIIWGIQFYSANREQHLLNLASF